MRRMFCPKCGSLMISSGNVFVCTSCGFEVEKNSKNHSKKIVSKSNNKEVVLIKEEKNAEPLDSDAVCPKCKHVGAYFLLKQTRSADEPETKFYTCEACGYRWREY